jgi:hypothetical protein
MGNLVKTDSVSNGGSLTFVPVLTQMSQRHALEEH